MSTTFEIAEVAQRSGFTAATLRYYEELGISPRVATGSPRGGAIDLQEGSGFQNVATSRNGGSRLHATLGSSAGQPSTS